jgi:zinc protease
MGRSFPLLLLVSLCAGSASAAIPKASYKLNLEEYSIHMTDFRFPSGLRIIFQSERSQPIVAITSVIDSGGSNDQQGYEGIAHVVEHLNFRAKHGDLPKNWDTILELGGDLNASTSSDWTNYMTLAPVDAAVPLLHLEAVRLKNAVENVTEADVRAESEIARNELRQTHENAAVGALFDSALPKMLYPPGHPYSRPVIGTHESLGNLDLAHTQEYVDNNYVPSKTTIVVVGDFDLKETWPLVMKAFDTELELLMAPEDAKAYVALKDANAQNKFLQSWVPKLQEYMQKSGETAYTPRQDCAARQEPPMPPDQGPAYVRGQVDNTTVVLAWSLPGAYCEDQAVMGASAGTLGYVILTGLFPDWEYAKADAPLEDFGCYVYEGRLTSTMFCYIGVDPSKGYTPEQLIERAANGLYLQWDVAQVEPAVRSFVTWNYGNAQNLYMANVLKNVDVVADIGGGRATQTAMFSHFTGDPAVFSENISATKTIELGAMRDFATKYLTRERMVSGVVDPLDVKERLRREADAQKGSRSETVKTYEATTGEDRYKRLFAAADITPEAIERVAVHPDRSKIREFTLDNGLKVALMNYGEAPIARVELRVFGGEGSAPKPGVDTLGEALYVTGQESTDDILAVAGFAGRNDPNEAPNSIYAQGSSGNIDALLHRVAYLTMDYDWTIADKKILAKSYIQQLNREARQPEFWATKLRTERLFPHHPAGVNITAADIRSALDYSTEDFKGWIYRKWQPANAQLVVVGKLDFEDVEQAVRKYMGGWEKDPSVEEGKIPDWPKPTERPDRQVLVFDAPDYTQTQVVLMCQLERTTDQDDAKSEVVAEVLSEMAWRKLREEKGVTYGAGAGAQLWKGGTARLVISSLVQNDSAGFAAQTMFDLVELAAKGQVEPDAVATAKWKLARTWGLHEQAVSQMASKLLSTGLGEFDYFDYYPKTLAAVGISDFAQVMGPCGGHEVVTMTGPRSTVEPQLKEKGIAYEVVDWQAMSIATLTKKDLKEYNKWKTAMDKRLALADAAAAEEEEGTK